MKMNDIMSKYDIEQDFFCQAAEGYKNTFESWAKVLTAKALEKLVRGASRCGYMEYPEMDGEGKVRIVRDKIQGGANKYLAELGDENSHWTEDQDFADEPMTQQYTWMERKGWLRAEYTKGGTPKTHEEREMFRDLGLVKASWQRMTDDGVVIKTWKDEQWY